MAHRNSVKVKLNLQKTDGSFHRRTSSLMLSTGASEKQVEAPQRGAPAKNNLTYMSSDPYKDRGSKLEGGSCPGSSRAGDNVDRGPPAPFKSDSRGCSKALNPSLDHVTHLCATSDGTSVPAVFTLHPKMLQFKPFSERSAS